MAGGEDAEDPTPDFFSGADGAGAHPAFGSRSRRPRIRPGSLLIASTDLLEPTFRRSIVYMIEHNDGGSLGVVINQMSQTAVHNLLPQWADAAASPRAVFVGGPVKQDSALCLGVLKPGHEPVEGLRPVDGRVVLVDLDADPESVVDLLEGVRVFAGYAGWGVGQLDEELDQDSWMTASALPKDLLCPPTVELWSSVLRRQPWPMPLLATHPVDVIGN